VSKARLEVAVRPIGEVWQSANDEAGIAALVDRLQVLAPPPVVLEATGGLERLVTAALAGLSVVVVNPRQVRDARQGDRTIGQDRCRGCRGAGALCPGAPADPASVS
jgi:transposase